MPKINLYRLVSILFFVLFAIVSLYESGQDYSERIFKPQALFPTVLSNVREISGAPLPEKRR